VSNTINGKLTALGSAAAHNTRNKKKIANFSLGDKSWQYLKGHRQNSPTRKLLRSGRNSCCKTRRAQLLWQVALRQRNMFEIKSLLLVSELLPQSFERASDKAGASFCRLKSPGRHAAVVPLSRHAWRLLKPTQSFTKPLTRVRCFGAHNFSG
jgi:hypothetical protein